MLCANCTTLGSRKTADEMFGMDGLDREVSVAWNSGVLSGSDIGSAGDGSFGGGYDGHTASRRACSEPDDPNNLLMFSPGAVAPFALSLQCITTKSASWRIS
jgi:hypothetical protein